MQELVVSALASNSTQIVVMAPTAAADIRQAVLSCVRSSSSSSAQRVGELFSVDPESSTPQQWADASLPYNTRLADEIGPLAIVYRESGRVVETVLFQTRPDRAACTGQ